MLTVNKCAKPTLCKQITVSFLNKNNPAILCCLYYPPITSDVYNFETDQNSVNYEHVKFNCFILILRCETGFRNTNKNRYRGKLPAVITSLDSTLYHCHQQCFSPKYRRIVFFQLYFFLDLSPQNIVSFL